MEDEGHLDLPAYPEIPSLPIAPNFLEKKSLHYLLSISETTNAGKALNSFPIPHPFNSDGSRGT